MKNKLGVIGIIVLVIFFGSIIILGVKSDRELKNKNKDEYLAWYKEKNTGSNIEILKDYEEETLTQDLYSKIKESKKIHILVLGDKIALSEGRESEDGIWTEGIKYILNKNYGIESEVDIIGKGPDKTNDGLKNATDAAIDKYDLIITCFGYNDSIGEGTASDFKNTYKEMLEVLENRNKNVVKMILIPSNVDEPYRESIKSLATEKNLLIIDPREDMMTYESNKKKYTKDGLPTNIAYQTYTKTLENIIKSNVGY